MPNTAIRNAQLAAPSDPFDLLYALELSSLELTVIAYSSAPLFRKPAYCLTVHLDETKKRRVKIIFSIHKITPNRDLDNDSLVYFSSCREDISDVWRMFR